MLAKHSSQRKNQMRKNEKKKNRLKCGDQNNKAKDFKFYF